MDVYFKGGTNPLVSNVASGWNHATGNKDGAICTLGVCETGSTAACSGTVKVTN